MFDLSWSQARFKLSQAQLKMDSGGSQVELKLLTNSIQLGVNFDSNWI